MSERSEEWQREGTKVEAANRGTRAAPAAAEQGRSKGDLLILFHDGGSTSSGARTDAA